MNANLAEEVEVPPSNKSSVMLRGLRAPLFGETTTLPFPALFPRVRFDPEALLIVSAPLSVIVLAPKVSVPTTVPLVNVPTPALSILVIPFKERRPVVIATLPLDTSKPPDVIVSPPEATVSVVTDGEVANTAKPLPVSSERIEESSLEVADPVFVVRVLVPSVTTNEEAARAFRVVDPEVVRLTTPDRLPPAIKLAP